MYPLSFSEFMSVYKGDKYYFSDLGLRNARINFRQFKQTHSMENIIYNELRMRGFCVDAGVIPIAEKGKDGKVKELSH